MGLLVPPKVSADTSANISADTGDRGKNTESDPAVVFTTAHAAHSLTVEEAARKHPVRLRAVVTYYDPYIDPRRPSFFVSDAEGGQWVEIEARACPQRAPKQPCPHRYSG